MSITMIGVAVVISMLLLYASVVFNRFVRNRNMVQDAWSNIDVALKKRHDLIPNLVNQGKEHAVDERETSPQVIALGNTAVSGNADDTEGRIKVENQLPQSIGRFLAVVEAYPDLKADTSF